MLKKMIIAIMKKYGYSDYFAPIAARLWYSDLFCFDGASLAEKIWAYRHGYFLSLHTETSLDRKNYQDFLPDVPYLKLHPISGAFQVWIDDKLTFRYLLAPYRRFLPEYYFCLERNLFYKLMDCPDDIEPTPKGLRRLLALKGHLVMKKKAGTGSKGFFHVEDRDGCIYLNDVSMSERNFADFCLNLQSYLVTEFVTVHECFQNPNGLNASTLRLTIINPHGGDPFLMDSFLRNWSEFSPKEDNRNKEYLQRIDIETGRTISRNLDKKIEGRPVPDTTKVFMVPFWTEILQTVLEISRFLPQIRFSGFDVLVTENGFKILEINSHPDISDFPILRNPDCKAFFQGALRERGLLA